MKRPSVAGSISQQSRTTTDTKALKNDSKNATHLIEHRTLDQFAKQMAMDDASNFISMNLKKRKPIFKNYIHNNASIIRKEYQVGKAQ